MNMDGGCVSNMDSNRMAPLVALVKVASVAAGVQFSWSLQYSLLTPYVQELGFSHTFASYVWLCGPISGILVQPIVGLYSDSWYGSWGRRRPFIILGAGLAVVAELLIGFSSDIGYILGDTSQSRSRAITVFLLGFWLLDIANNSLQIPCRALLADFAGKDVRRTRQGNTCFAFFMAIGNILGFAASSYNNWSIIFPFTKTNACDLACSNLKSTFLVDIFLVMSTTFLSVTAVKEIPWSRKKQKYEYQSTSSSTHLLPNTSNTMSECGAQNFEDDDIDNKMQLNEPVAWVLLGKIHDLPKEMLPIFLITALNAFALSSFSLFDTDWMGREVYGGKPNSASPKQKQLYIAGVGMGAFGLMLGSVVLGLCSLMIEPLCQRVNINYIWASSNVLLFGCLASTIVISLASKYAPSYGHTAPSISIVVASLAMVSIIGVALAVASSVPYALLATFTTSSNGGQGLSMGVLNLAVTLSQFMVSVGSGPWDALFGGGNLPSFTLGSAIALFSGILASFILPKTSYE